MINHYAWTATHHRIPIKGAVAKTRFFFANPRLRARYAHQKAHATKGGPIVRYRRLPARKGARRR